MSNRARTGLKVGLTVLLLVFLALRMDLRQFWNVLASARWALVAVAVLIQLCTAVLSIGRWQLIVRKFDIQTPLSGLAQMTFIGYFFNLFLPSAFGGDFFRAYYLSKREKRGMSTTITTILLDRAGGLVSLLLIGTLALAFNPIRVRGVPLLPVFAAMLVAFLVGIVLLFNDWTHRGIRRLLERFNREDIETKMELVAGGLERLRRSPGTIVALMSISMVIQVAVVIMMWVAALAISIDAPLAVFFSFIPVVNVSLAVPLTINGLGSPGDRVLSALFSDRRAGRIGGDSVSAAVSGGAGHGPARRCRLHALQAKRPRGRE